LGVRHLDKTCIAVIINTDQSVCIDMQQRSEETITQIIAAATELFCRSGYDATGVAEICSTAGVSKGAFYHHFPSKQALFLTILDRWLYGIDQNLSAFRRENKPVPQTLNRMVGTIGTVFQVARGQLPMFMEFMVQASRDEEVWQAAISPYRRYQQQFAALISEGVREGSFREDLDANTSAWVLMALAVGILLQGVVDPSVADWEAVARQGIELFISSMKRSNP